MRARPRIPLAAAAAAAHGTPVAPGYALRGHRLDHTPQALRTPRGAVLRTPHGHCTGTPLPRMSPSQCRRFLCERNKDYACDYLPSTVSA